MLYFAVIAKGLSRKFRNSSCKVTRGQGPGECLVLDQWCTMELSSNQCMNVSHMCDMCISNFLEATLRKQKGSGDINFNSVLYFI